MEDYQEKVAKLLLQSKSIKLEPTNPFTWASGWKSPIYCDNRKILSFPGVRTFIKNQFVELVREQYPRTNTIAGVATGAIAISALVAEELKLPMIYVRPTPKKHGLGNQIEGYLDRKGQVLVIEDLISTGGSSLNAINALRDAGANVNVMIAIFTYGFEVASRRFEEAGVEWITLSNYNILLKVARENDMIKQDQLSVLEKWKENPEIWSPDSKQ